MLKIGANTVAEVRNWEIEEENDVLEDTVMGDNWATHKSGIGRWRGRWSGTSVDLLGSVIGGLADLQPRDEAAFDERRDALAVAKVEMGAGLEPIRDHDPRRPLGGTIRGAPVDEGHERRCDNTTNWRVRAYNLYM